MVATWLGIIPIIPHPFSATASKIGAFYNILCGCMDLRGKRAGRGLDGRGSGNQVTAGHIIRAKMNGSGPKRNT